jgi:NAD(P)-dependent dehydrogenase (short-subunit alcohol dehydrogenase family)
MIQEIETRLGAIDMLVNNAGIAVVRGTTSKSPNPSP